MSESTNYFRIGLFVIGGLILFAAGVVILGAGALFKDKIMMETYFQESVSGLDKGAPVKFRGVRIGEVSRIVLAHMEYDTERGDILVRMALDPTTLDEDKWEDEFAVELQKEIDEGLRVRLASQGITGQMYLEMDILDVKLFPVQKLEWTPAYPYIPSTPATLTRFTDAVDRILRKVEAIDVKGISGGLNSSLQALDEAVRGFRAGDVAEESIALIKEVREAVKLIRDILADEDIDALLNDASKTLASVRRVTEKSEEPIAETMATLPETAERVQSLSKSLDAAAADLPQTIALLTRTMREVNEMLILQQHNIDSTLKNVRIISQNLRELTENAKRYPSQVLFGEPPTRRENTKK